LFPSVKNQKRGSRESSAFPAKQAADQALTAGESRLVQFRAKDLQHSVAVFYG